MTASEDQKLTEFRGQQRAAVDRGFTAVDQRFAIRRTR
jgi:hypothetical protein